MSIQFSGVIPGVRTWYQSEIGDRVIQVQPDRLVLNWRRAAKDQPYPSYENLRPEFETALQQLSTFVEKENLGALAISQAEVTYSNPIPVSSLGPNKDPSRLLAPWTGDYSDAFLPPVEDLRLNARYQIPDPVSGDPAGRLYVECGPAVSAGPGIMEREEIYLLQLFARGRPLGAGMDGAIAFLDLGHKWVINGFASLTTRPMHKEWDRQE